MLDGDMWVLIVVIIIGAFVVLYLGTAIFERVVPMRVRRAYQRLTNRFQAPVYGFMPGWVIVETTGRKTGLTRRTPLGGRRSGNSVYVIAGDGRASAWVLNIEASPRVRVKRYGRWRRGTAHILPDEDPRKVALRMNPVNGLFILIAGTDLLTVRIDLD